MIDGVILMLMTMGGSTTPATEVPSCTAQWLATRATLPVAQRYDRARADAFGRTCLGVRGPVPIDWAAVRADLDRLIGSDHRLVATVPADVEALCPGYRRASAAERAGFWRELAYEVIKPEAGTDAHALMWEQPRDAAGRPSGGEYSIGLLQLSISNAAPYGCDVPTEASLLEPTRNLACGVRIVERLVTRDSRIGGDAAHGRLGLGRYWSTIRVAERKPAGSARRDTRGPILTATRRLPQCRA